jgi:A/G-specific adenine glycosylase
VAAIAFDEAATVVDGNVERVISRLFRRRNARFRPPSPTSPRLAATLTPATRPGDHAQAMMDLGATICTPRNPACTLCPLNQLCQARAQGIAADLPRKAAKAEKPTREGTLWLARQGALLAGDAPRPRPSGRDARLSRRWLGRRRRPAARRRRLADRPRSATPSPIST